jgi:predicted metal-dependent hydrolase
VPRVPDSKKLPEPAGEVLSSRDARYLRGIAHFNAREFYDAHEVWEDLWHTLHEREAEFVQGLIQFATALHHFEAQNLKGARILYQGGVELLSPIGDFYWGLPVKKFLDDMHACMKDVLPYAQKDLPGRYHPNKNEFPVRVDDKLIPKIVLVEERAS